MLLGAAGIALVVVGFMDQSFRIHDIALYIFAMLGLVAVFAMAFEDFAAKRRMTAGLMIIAAIIGLGMYLKDVSWTFALMTVVFGAVIAQSLKYLGSSDE